MKMKKFLSLLLSIAMLISVFCVIPVSAEGDEIEADTSWYDKSGETFTLTDAADLLGFASLASSYSFEGQTILLGDDITLNTGDASTWGTYPPAYSYSAEFVWNKAFQGTFDGQGHTISGLYIPSNTNHGSAMFRYVEGTAVIKNFTLTNSYIAGSKWSGAIVGKFAMGSVAAKSLTLSDVHVTGTTVTGTGTMVGGLAGTVQATTADNATVVIENCSFAGKVTSSKVKLGGLIGDAEKLTSLDIRNSYVDVELSYTGTTAVTGIGGLVGYIDRANANIQDCMITGSITATADSTGVSSLIGYITSKDTSKVKVECNRILLAVENEPADTLVGTVNSEFATYITYSASNIVYDSSKTAERLAISANAGELTAKGDTTANLQGTAAGFANWLVVASDYPLPKAPEVIGYQTTAVVGGTYSLRLVAVIYGGGCTSAGFKNFTVTADSKTTTAADYECSYVYTSITGGGNPYKASDLGGTYLMTVEIYDIPETITSFNISMAPYVRDAANNEMAGSNQSYTIDVSDSEDSD